MYKFIKIEDLMHILIIEPYFTGSHKSWAKGFQKHSKHDVEIISLEGRYWKWRMHGAAITLADQFNSGDYLPDLILATDMLDLTSFLALTRDKMHGVPTAIYFHENQLTYPWSAADRDIKLGRDNHYGFINFISALAANTVLFNSEYHQNSFLGALPNFLKGFPDYNELGSIPKIADKSKVLNLGLELSRFDEFKTARDPESPPVLLWNHRWEYDKNPGEFFNALYSLDEDGLDFKVIVLGENFSKQPEEFDTARERLAGKVIHFGYVESFEEYAKLIYRADIIPVTSNQDFFGGSIVEAMYCGVIPLLPNRLAYPQHIPIGMEGRLMYEDGELIPKLKSLLSTYSSVDRGAVKDHVTRYDWFQIVAEYDQVLEDYRLPK